MGSLLQERLQANKEEKSRIDKKVADSLVRVTQNEKEIVDGFIRAISDEFRKEITDPKTDRKALDAKIEKAIREKSKNLDVGYEQKKVIEKYAIANIIGLGPIQPFMEDPAVTEVVVQRYDNICIEKEGKVIAVKEAFMSEENLRNVINRILQPIGRQVNLSTPIVDARLSDGSRVCATIPPVSPHGSTLCIRKFQNEKMTPEAYVRLGSISLEGMLFLKACVEARLSIFVSGGTGTGKTTMLNALSTFLPENELIITIEDTLELQLKQRNVRSLETRQANNDNMMPVTIASLVKAALRMRPDRIVVGETRDEAIIQFLNAASTGHEGSMTTAHANSPRNLVDVRIPIMMSMDGASNFSEESRAMQIAEAVNIIIQLERLPNGKRIVSRIVAVDGLTQGKRVNLCDVYVYNRQTGNFKCTHKLPKYILDKFRDRKVALPDTFTELPKTGGPET